jgi:hypothetical protein
MKQNDYSYQIKNYLGQHCPCLNNNDVSHVSLWYKNHLKFNTIMSISKSAMNLIG